MKKIHISSLFFIMISLVFLPSCKTADETSDFNIVGNWNITLSYDPSGTLSGTITFTGTESSGVVSINIDGPGTGTYTVDDRSVSMTWSWSGSMEEINLTGDATTDNSMTGTFLTTDSYSGTWTSSRQSVRTILKVN